MTSRLVNNTGTLTPSIVLIYSTPPAARTWFLNKFNTTFTNIFTPHYEPDPASDPAASSPYINLNILKHFLSDIKLPGLSPPSAIANSPTEPIIEDTYTIFCEEIYLHLKLCRLNAGVKASPPTYLSRLTGKHVYESIKGQIITSQVHNTYYHDVQHVPLPATLLKNIKNRK